MRVVATVVATTTVALALGVTAAALVWALRGRLEATADQDAERRVAGAAQLVVARAEAGTAAPAPAGTVGSGSAAGSGGAAGPGSAAGPGEPGQRGVAVLSAGGPASGSAASAAGVPPDPDVLVATMAEPGWGDGYRTVTKVVAAPGGAVTLQARSSLEPIRAALDALRPLLFVGVPALLLLVAGLTWVLVGRALAPVAAIRERFTDITASDLHRRVPVPPTRDEVARLAVAMNATLDRLETAVRQHRRFVADAAHELRSPIATLRTRLELGRRAVLEPAADTLVEESLVDMSRIQALAADLLLLSRLDAKEPLRLEEVDLGQVAAEAAAEASLRSPREGIRLDLDVAPDVVLPGSRSHLARLVGNLADNALRHAASAVTVRVCGPGTVEVIDDGPGIPLEHHERVFDRFTRLDEARDRDAGGCGLGLAIARDIALAHGGTLVVEAADGPGARFRADLRVTAG